MPLDWDRVAVAVACRVQYEQACGRGRLISEDVTRLALAEVVQSQAAGNVEAEMNHPDVPGSARLDLIVRSPRAGNIEVAIEHKWVRATTDSSIRHWAAEIFSDVLRVERLSQQMAQNCERAVVVVGEEREMRKVWEREVRQGGGQARLRIMDAILQDRSSTKACQPFPHSVNLRSAGAPYQALIKLGAIELYAQLPVSYQTHLVAYHQTKIDGIECAVWLVTRGQGQRVLFNANTEWPTVQATPQLVVPTPSVAGP